MDKTSGTLAVALATLLLSACDYTEAHDMLIRGGAEQSGRPVALYFVGDSPHRPFHEIAMLEVIGHGADADTERIESSLRLRGEEFGCDAVVRVHVDQDFATARGAGVCARYTTADAVACGPVPSPSAATTCEPDGTYLRPPACRPQ